MTLDNALRYLTESSGIRRAGWASLPYGDGTKTTSMHIAQSAGKPYLVVAGTIAGWGPHKWTATDKAATDWEVVP